MRFEKHLFISYAHIDNLPLPPEEQGWISRFHASLDALLSMRMGQKAEIWRDSKLAGNDIFGDEIVAQFPKTALLLSVLSPGYLESKWCTRELEEFCKAAEHCAGLAIENKCRILKIIKLPLDRDKDDPLPPVMKSVLGYEFYMLDERKAPLELDPAYGKEIAQKYLVKIAQLAWEISQILKLLEKTELGSPGSQSQVAPPSRPAVYLAECSYDQQEARAALAAELKCHGYKVLPEHALSRDEATYTAQVRDLLKQCRLSIHLVGSGYGSVPDGPSAKSIVVLQNEIAIRRCRESGLRRILWLPEGTTSWQPEQTAFIDRLRTDAEAQFGADLISSSEPEEVKGAIRALLQKLQDRPAATPVRSATGRKMIYLICDRKDRESTRPLRKHLSSRGFEVKIPVFEGDAATVRQANQDRLLQCNGVLVYYGEGGEAWKESVDSELRKLRGSREISPRFPLYTYLAPPETEAKRDLVELEEPQLLNCVGGSLEDSLLPFLDSLERSGP